MADHSSIEWTEATWNVVTGCDRVSPGCDHCYIERTPPLRIGRRRFDDQGRMGIQLHPDRLDWPTRWRKPRLIFTPSLGDLFHHDVSEDFICQVFDVMAATPHHTYQVLTKRPKRMRSLFSDNDSIWDRLGVSALPNVWLGTSIESDRYTFRADLIRDMDAAVRWLSLEPLLGPLPSLDLTGIGWVVAGGESGPGARPMHPDWARDIRDRCAAAGIPFFFKQWGAWEPLEPVYTDDDGHDDVLLDGYDNTDIVSFNKAGIIEQTLPKVGSPHGHQPDPAGDPWWMAKVGKKAAGRELDGRHWDQMPLARP